MGAWSTAGSVAVPVAVAAGGEVLVVMADFFSPLAEILLLQFWNNQFLLCGAKDNPQYECTS